MSLRLRRVGSASTSPSSGAGASGNGGLPLNPSQKRADRILTFQHMSVVGGLFVFLFGSMAFKQWYSLGLFVAWIFVAIIAIRTGEHLMRSRQDEVNTRFSELLDEPPPE